MKCMICKNGDTEDGFTTITLEKNGSTIIFKQVPALVCDNCGEQYVQGDVTSAILMKSREIIASGVKVDIRDYQLSVA